MVTFIQVIIVRLFQKIWFHRPHFSGVVLTWIESFSIFWTVKNKSSCLVLISVENFASHRKWQYRLKRLYPDVAIWMFLFILTQPKNFILMRIRPRNFSLAKPHFHSRACVLIPGIICVLCNPEVQSQYHLLPWHKTGVVWAKSEIVYLLRETKMLPSP